MRVRALDANGDMTFGQSQANFLVNSPAAIAQCVVTRLGLFVGQWFLDTTDGTPWATQVIGKGTSATYDQAIKARILGTQGVTGIVSYSSTVTGRALAVQCAINTAYGMAEVATTL